MSRTALATALAVAALVVGLGAVAAVDPGNPAEGVDRERNESAIEPSPFVGGAGGGSGFYIDVPLPTPGGVSVPLPGPAAVLGALVVGLAVLWYRSDAEASLDGFGGEGSDATGGDADLAAVGRAAGAAADRIDADADVTNEVYRAWDEMRGHVDGLDPDTAAPGEFADAAVEAGMDPTDVAELTELFAEVRYGGRDPADRADRAVAALRRIERTYGEGEGTDGQPAGDGDATDAEGDSR